MSVASVCMILFVKFSQICSRLGSPAVGEESWHRQEHQQTGIHETTRTHENKLELACDSHHFHPRIEKPGLFVMELHIQLAKDSEQLKERDLAESGQVSVLLLSHTNQVCYKSNNNVHKLLKLVPCTNFQRIQIWLLLHLHHPNLTKINFSCELQGMDSGKHSSSLVKLPQYKATLYMSCTCHLS